MRIAVNTRFLLSSYLEGVGNFTWQAFRYLAIKHSQHQFIFIFDRPFDQRFIVSPNIIPVVAPPPARHPILWTYWFDVKIPAVLRKYKADVFVSPDGFCSLTTSIPQCLVLHDLAFLHYASDFKKSHLRFMKKRIPAGLTKAKVIATVSEFSKKDIESNYQIEADKIDVVYNGVGELFTPCTGSSALDTKHRYTGGAEYFLYLGSIHPRKNLLTLLKAFSIFKKRQQSNFKLVLAGRLAWKYDSFLDDLKTYKYREDVILAGYVPENDLPGLLGAAYSLVYPSLSEGFGVPVIEAMRCDVPVITSPDSPMQEVAQDAALYADPKNLEDLADKMMRIYKDEALRTQLIEKGRAIVSAYSWERTGDLLWQTILKAVK